MKKWAAEFKQGKESVGNDGRSVRPKDDTTAENVKAMHTLAMCYRRRDMRSIASEVDISSGEVQSIQTGILGISKFRQELTDDQKRRWFEISLYLLSRYEDDPGDFIERVVTQDETWVHHFDPESKMQSKQWKHPCSPPS